MTDATPLPPILPIGTAVVALVEVRGQDGRPSQPRGAAGVIIAAPFDVDHSYRVRFPGGEEASLKRRELQALRRFQSEGYEARADPLTEHNLYDHVVFRCIVGSRAYGLDHAASDVDRRGVYLPPASMHWSVFGVPEQLENQETEECYWELEKFIKLALKANPNVLEALYSPLVEHVDPVARPMLDRRSVFLSKLIFQTYNGYAMSQFRKLEHDLSTKGRVKWKHAMHLIRLVLAGIIALREHAVPVAVTEHRDELLAIRDGKMPWPEIERWRIELHARFTEEFGRSTLPDRPDYEAANAILISARREMAEREKTSREGRA